MSHDQDPLERAGIYARALRDTCGMSMRLNNIVRYMLLLAHERLTYPEKDIRTVPVFEIFVRCIQETGTPSPPGVEEDVVASLKTTKQSLYDRTGDHYALKDLLLRVADFAKCPDVWGTEGMARSLEAWTDMCST